MYKKIVFMFLSFVMLFPSTTFAEKETVVLMPLQLLGVDDSYKMSMETALVEGLQIKYKVFSGDQVQKKVREIFNRESKAAVGRDCDETKCFQDIAVAFQTELIAYAEVLRNNEGYLLTLNVRNVLDDVVIVSKSMPCERCSEFQVVEKLKLLAGGEKAKLDTPLFKKTSDTNMELALWNSIKDSNDANMFNAYLEQYPNGTFSGVAKVKIKQLSGDVGTVKSKALSRYVDNANGTVTDNQTSLIWQQRDDNNKRTWYKSITYCDNLLLADYRDWRLPTKKELLTIVDKSKGKPAIDGSYFKDTKMSGFWDILSTGYWTYDTSRDKKVNNSNIITKQAYAVNFKSGKAWHTNRLADFWVRCVRSVQ